MKKFIFILFFILPACKTFTGAGSLIGIKAADKMQIAEKVTGIEKATIDTKMHVETQGQIGQTVTSEKTQAGRDVSSKVINDSKVVSQNETHWYYIVGLLILYIGRMEYNNSKKAAQIMAFVNRQEDTQNKYIETLERQAFKNKEAL